MCLFQFLQNPALQVPRKNDFDPYLIFCMSFPNISDKRPGSVICLKCAFSFSIETTFIVFTNVACPCSKQGIPDFFSMPYRRKGNQLFQKFPLWGKDGKVLKV